MGKNGIAQFEKVTKGQFFKDMKDTFGNEYDNDILESMYNSIKLPFRSTMQAAGYDIFAPIHIILNPGEVMKIPTGIRCNMDKNWFLGILPRSGHGFKYGIHLANTMGIIDSDYYDSDNEGHIFIKIINDSCIEKAVDIPLGQAMAQGIFMPYGITMDDKPGKIRNGGFGSTNIRN